MTDTRHMLNGSEHLAPRDMIATGRVSGDEPITVSVYLQPSDADPVMSPVAGTSHSRATLRAARNETQAANIAVIVRFAAQAGLAVVETDAVRRLVKLRGTASTLEAA